MSIYKFYALPDLAARQIPKLEHDTFIIDKDQLHYFPIDEVMLSGCYKFPCKKPSLIRQTSVAGCGIAQFMGASLETCPWEQFAAPYLFHQTMEGFVYAIRVAYKVVTNCSGKRYRSKTVEGKIMGYGYKKISPGCRTTLHPIGQGQGGSIRIEGPLGTLSVMVEDLDKLKVKDTIFTEAISIIQAPRFTNMRNLSIIRNDFNASIYETFSKIKHLQKIKTKIFDSHKKRITNIIAITILSGIIGAVILIIIIVCLYKRLSAIKTLIYCSQQTAKFMRMNKKEDDEDTIGSYEVNPPIAPPTSPITARAHPDTEEQLKKDLEKLHQLEDVYGKAQKYAALKKSDGLKPLVPLRKPPRVHLGEDKNSEQNESNAYRSNPSPIGVSSATPTMRHHYNLSKKETSSGKCRRGYIVDSDQAPQEFYVD